MNPKIILNQDSRKKVKKEMAWAQTQGEIRYYQRLQAFLLLDSRLPLEQVASILMRTLRTLYTWLNLFIEKGVTALRLKAPKGRKPKLNKAQKQILKARVISGPEACGYRSGRWTSALIQDFIFRQWGKEYAIKYIPELLKSLGLSHKKMELFSHRADQRIQATWLIKVWPELLQKARQEGAVILYEDESTFRMWSRNAYSWGEKGEQLKGSVFMNNVLQKVFGALELNTGRFIFKQAKSLKASEFVDFLKYLLSHYSQKIYLVVDNGSSHKGKKVSDFLSKYTRIELVRLPTYSPHLNPIEKLWKQIKQERLHNRFFASEKLFRKELLNALRLFQDEPSRSDGFLKKWRETELCAAS